MSEERLSGARLANRWLRWLLVTGNRLTVAGALLGGVFLVFSVLTYVDVLSGRPSSPMYFLFSALLGGNFTLITVVLSINQLVLSRELGAPGELRQRLEGALEYREDVQARAGWSAGPVKPGEFLLSLHESTSDRTEELREQVADTTDDRLREHVEQLVDELLEDVSRVTRALDADSARIFTVIEATLGTNHATQLRDIDRIASDFDDRLSDDQRDLLAAIRTNLLDIDVARKYFRTVYIEKELSVLSRILLYVGVPAEVLTAVVLVVYGGVKTTPLTAGWLNSLVPVAIVAGFAPLAILFSFVLRLAWVAQRNASIAPFTTSDEELRF
ncbi:hypothetical protein [Halomicrococcus sp. SG-WS-1]|uniref:hypothetical protein n=1 Tax=Halomicrococcus sp. SG-WS-1 TaxID=3439057 RepID=UPI003F793C3E